MAKIELVTKYLDIFSAAFPGREVTEKTIAVYVQYLREIPDDVFIIAADRCIKTSKFFPTIAEIYEKAEPELEEWKKREYNIQDRTNQVLRFKKRYGDDWKIQLAAWDAKEEKELKQRRGYGFSDEDEKINAIAEKRAEAEIALLNSKG